MKNHHRAFGDGLSLSNLLSGWLVAIAFVPFPLCHIFIHCFSIFQACANLTGSFERAKKMGSGLGLLVRPMDYVVRSYVARTYM